MRETRAIADLFTQFSCLFDVGSGGHAAQADLIRGELAAELDRGEGASLGFSMAVDHETGPGALWLHSDEYGEPEHTWSHSCTKPRLDAFGGGAHVLDLGKRATLADIDCSNFVHERTAAAARQAVETAP